MANRIGRENLTQQEFDALALLVILGRWEAAARALFTPEDEASDEEVVQAIFAIMGSQSGHLPRFRSIVAVFRHGDYSGNERNFDPLNLAL